MKIYLKTFLMKMFSFVLYIFRVCSIDNNAIYVINFTDKGYSDNPRYIIEQLLKKNDKLKIYWKTNQHNFPNDNIFPVKPHSFKDFYYLSTSKVIISNVRLPIYYKKRKKQFYLETWHGSIALKKIGYDGNNRTYFSNESVKHFAKYCDLIISNSTFTTEMYRKAFGYSGRIEQVGTPRVDAMLNANAPLLRNKLGIDNNDLVITYAPTFREDGMDNFLPLDYKLIIDEFERIYKKKVVLLFRLHPVMKMELGDCSVGRIINDEYLNLYETLAITDILISDYSSLIFEFMLLKRPIILYIPDVEYYTSVRGTYFDIYELPFIKAKSSTELISIINQQKCLVTNELDKFIKKLGVNEPGNASEMVSNIIIKQIER